ncbi:MAG: hypothetical protein U0835_16240 [Isosphaeraceae bacterium]
MNLWKRIVATGLAALALAAVPRPASAEFLVGLNARNQIVTFDGAARHARDDRDPLRPGRRRLDRGHRLPPGDRAALRRVAELRIYTIDPFTGNARWPAP